MSVLCKTDVLKLFIFDFTNELKHGLFFHITSMSEIQTNTYIPQIYYILFEKQNFLQKKTNKLKWDYSMAGKSMHQMCCIYKCYTINNV